MAGPPVIIFASPFCLPQSDDSLNLAFPLLNSDKMLSTAVDSDSKLTASGVPLQHQPTTKTASKGGGSYTQAMTADMMWEWRADDTHATPLPQDVQRVQGQLENQLPPKHVGSPTVSGRKVPQVGGASSVSPVTTTLTPGGIVHYGFVPYGKRDVPEATQPCELPGSRNPPTPAVITVPPQKPAVERLNSASSSAPPKSGKAVSIEQAGRQMESYAPSLSGAQKSLDYEDDFEDTPPNMFCMELSALVTGVEKPLEYMAIPGVEEKRPSILSNISVWRFVCPACECTYGYIVCSAYECTYGYIVCSAYECTYGYIVCSAYECTYGYIVCPAYAQAHPFTSLPLLPPSAVSRKHGR